MRHLIQRSLVSLALLSAACSADETSSFQNYLTGEACEPNESYVPNGKSGEHGRGGHNSPTGMPGDNIDDAHSGKVDCLGDGNSGQGNDERLCFPGCDDTGCCDEEATPDDGGGTPDDGSGTPDDGSGTPDDGGGSSCSSYCGSDGACGDGLTCSSDGCCVPDAVIVE